MSFWIKNTEGYRDAMLTLAVVGFVTILVKFFIAGIAIKGFIVFGAAPDAATIGALLTPTLGAYVMRRYTDKKYDAAEVQKTITTTVQTAKTKIEEVLSGKPVADEIPAGKPTIED